MADNEQNGTLPESRRSGGFTRRTLYATGAVVAVEVLAARAAYGQFTPSETPVGAAVPAKAPAPGSCAAQRLPVPKDSVSSIVSGGDRSGRFLLGRSTDAAGAETSLIWRDGDLVTTVKVPGAKGALTGVNAAGDAVASSLDANGVKQAHVLRGGKFTQLTGGVQGTAALAINDQGTVVGWRKPYEENPQAVVWAAGKNKPTDLKSIIGHGGAIAIDTDGTIIGLLFYPAEAYFGFMWRPDGTSVRLPTVREGANEHILWPTSIANGIVTGRLGNEEGLPATYNIKSGVTTVIKEKVGKGAVNREGSFAGRTANGLAVVTPNGRTALALPMGANAASAQTQIKTLSDDGLVVGGQYTDEQGKTRALRWYCR
jgi:uncharacterized membrane protein